MKFPKNQLPNAQNTEGGCFPPQNSQNFSILKNLCTEFSFFLLWITTNRYFCGISKIEKKSVYPSLSKTR